MLIAAAILITISGIALVVIGIRGRSIGNHPVCRCCGFDLFGRPAESFVCSECGAGLAAPRSTRTGHHQWRVGFLALGILAVLAGLVFNAPSVWTAFQDFNVLQHLPLQYVMKRAQGHDGIQRIEAFRELLRRAQAAEIAPNSWPAVADLEVASLSDPSKGWNQNGIDLMFEGRRCGRVDDARWQSFARAIANFAVAGKQQGVSALAPLETLTGRDPNLNFVLVEALLAYQADDTKPWNSAWANAAELIWSRGGMTLEQKRKFVGALSQGALTLQMYPTVRQGDLLKSVVELGTIRNGNHLPLYGFLTAYSVQWSGGKVTPDPTFSIGLPLDFQRMMINDKVACPAATGTLPVGKHVLKILVSVRVFDKKTNETFPEKTVTLTGDVTVLPPS